MQTPANGFCTADGCVNECHGSAGVRPETANQSPVALTVAFSGAEGELEVGEEVGGGGGGGVPACLCVKSGQLLSLAS